MADNRGASALRALPLSQGQIARRCGVSQQVVSKWASARAKPGDANRAVLETDYRVAASWWDEQVGEALPAPPAPAEPRPEPPRPALVTRPALPATVPPPETPAADREASDGASALDLAREQVRALKRAIRVAAPGEVLDIQKALTQAIATQGRLERIEEARIARILKSPEWKRMESALVEALKPFGPAPLRAVHDALAELEATEEPARSAAA